MEFNIASITAPAFDIVFYDLQAHKHTFYWLAGGRGSTKSSFVGINVPLLMLQHPVCHAVVLRKVRNTIKNSVYPQVQWGIEQLGLLDRFKFITSPHEITYKATGQKILFFGLDDPAKVKSIKLPFGYVGIVWFEELDQFSGMEEIRNVLQSLLRGGSTYWVFCTYNPPKSRNNWVNEEILSDDADRLVHHSTYLGVPPSWLGEQFFLEADKLKAKSELLYRHEYLGEVTGTGGAVFENVEEIALPDERIGGFDYIYNGLDFGFAVDPLAYVRLAYDAKREDVYIFDELYQQKLTNRQAVERISSKVKGGRILADAAEPKSITEMASMGLRIFGARKGPDSVEFGMKWLQSRAHIYIDKRRCPNTYREFISYEYERNKDGQFISAYSDANNHAIDAVRYALSEVMSRERIAPRRVNY
ncbi:MAG: PBSX family phage terminase large subunit [Phascolarctobacterium sp.]|uniref:PBSX family phage terminase large subunit n=1 Tax=Phascolarctobacterium sp. TaxID=2049039 RepID=UPI0026DC5C92|nr:PBSX family phage terminase large subunit [Phascolarctobacterium sp.]MDO4920937.1 PBSX family phage terminase large subunit [Phascolarctobacterium sp.]